MKTALVVLSCSLLASCSDSGDAGRGGSGLDAGISDAAGTSLPKPDASTDAITTEQVHVGDFTFDVRLAGPPDGEAVILLHGFPETSFEWRHQMGALAGAGYRAIAPDQRGYSPGARPTAIEDYAVTLLAQDVVDIADALDVGQFHVVGHDWGAVVAWVVAKLAASRVLTAVPISVPHPDAFKEELSDTSSCQYSASSYFDFFVTPGSTDAILAGDAGVLQTIYAELPPEDARVYLEAFGDREALDAALNWYRANIVDRMPQGPALGQVTVPTTFIWSDGDTYLCREGGELTAKYMDAPYEFEVVTGVGHWVPELAADRVNELLLARLSGGDR